VVCGLITLAMHPNAPVWNPHPFDPNEISLQRVLDASAPVIWLDARSRESYEQAHIPQAILLNEDEWDELFAVFLLEHWEIDSWVVVYCSSGGCEASKHVMLRLQEELPDVKAYYLKGGWEAWVNRDQ